MWTTPRAAFYLTLSPSAGALSTKLLQPEIQKACCPEFEGSNTKNCLGCSCCNVWLCSETSVGHSSVLPG